MNKFITVLGAAAVATFAGCKDPNYKPMNTPSQDEPKNIPVALEPEPQPQPIKTLEPAPVEVKTCKCAPGTKHTSPCTCGAPDCSCVVEVKPLPPPAVEPETTVYIVQRGDYLAKISKKFNIKVDAIKKLNNLSSDKIRIGQKLKLPGKVAVGEQKAPVQPVAQTKKPYTPYTGATKEYVVKNGDYLGKIAVANGITVRQLKELNTLKSDMLKVGQKLNVPAEKVVAAAPVAPEKPQVAKTPVEKPAPEKPAVAPVVETPAPQPTVSEPVPTDAVDAVEPEPAAADTVKGGVQTADYVVGEDEDLMKITLKLNLSPSVIRDLNDFPENVKLTPGQVIRVPADSLE